MYELHRSTIGDERVFPLAQHSLGSRLHSISSSSVDTILLGGGTLILADEWAQRLRSIQESVAHERLIIFGAGVHDLKGALNSGKLTENGLKQWVTLLESADFIGVRGPDSVQTLREIGVEAKAVGDPALCIPLDNHRRSVRQDKVMRIALNLTRVHDASFNTKRIRPMIARTVANWVREGIECSVFSMDSGDKAATILELQRAGLDTSRLRIVTRRDDIINTIARSNLVISERLHGAIIAANVETPFLHVSYKPKSDDFLRSIDSMQLSLGAKVETPEDIECLGSELMRGSASWIRSMHNKRELSEHFNEIYSTELISKLDH